MAKKVSRSRSVPSARALSKEAREEADPEWRNWFLEVERRRKELVDPKRAPWCFSRLEKEGVSETVVRRRVEPKRIEAFIKQDAKKTGRSFSIDTALILGAWNQVVGREIAEESEFYAFKNGVLTMTIFSSSLLQEIRQFHQDAILHDLRDIWPVAIPLLRIIYKTGQKKGR